MALSIQRESFRKKIVFFSDDFGLRSPVVHKIYRTKRARTAIAARTRPRSFQRKPPSRWWCVPLLLSWRKLRHQNRLWRSMRFLVVSCAVCRAKRQMVLRITRAAVEVRYHVWLLYFLSTGSPYRNTVWFAIFFFVFFAQDIIMLFTSGCTC